MIPKLLSLFLLTLSSISFSQELVFSELGYDPSLCRIYSYQNGGGVVYASATGGTPDYTYLWEDMTTGETYSGTTWGGRNPGNYAITVTDGIGSEISETLFLDSLNVIADFHAFSDDLIEVPGGYVGFAPDTIGFINLAERFAVPYIPHADTLFFWNFDHPESTWLVEEGMETQYKGYTHGGEFEVCLVATNYNSCRDTTCKTIGLFGSLVGIAAEDDSKTVSLTPVSKLKSITLNQSGFDEELTLRVYTGSGQLLIEKTIIETTTSFSFEQPKGVYL